MKSRFPAFAAAVLCCLSCVEANFQIGGNLIPENQIYQMVTGQKVPLSVEPLAIDSLSGYSRSWVTIGSVRDEELGLTTRTSVIYPMPISDTMDFGTNPVVKSLHMSMAADSVSVIDESQRNILQNVYVYGLKEPLDPKVTYDCNSDLSDKVDWSKRVSTTCPVINGTDSLSFNFTREYAEQFLTLTQEDLDDIKLYKKKIKGLYLCTDSPSGESGRINMLQLQLGFDKEYYFISGNYAVLSINSTYNGVRKDTSFLFYFSTNPIGNLDSVLLNTAAGSLPQNALNLTTQDKSRTDALKKDRTKLCIEGGGGLKPRISAKELKHQVTDLIKKNGHDPKKIIITKASLTFCYDAPDARYEGLKHFPAMLSPTVRLHGVDTSGGTSTRKVLYEGITDFSSENENQGDINYSLQQYAPDITYHLQELISTEDSLLVNGNYDVWLMIMAYRTSTTYDAEAAQMSDYYNTLAYQQYYNSMYGGYGGYGGYGYGGYGYGGYGYDSYSNYYSYMMAAQMASSSATSTSVSLEIDRDRFYKAFLCGTEYPDESRRPALVFSYAVPQ